MHQWGSFIVSSMLVIAVANSEGNKQLNKWFNNKNGGSRTISNCTNHMMAFLLTFIWNTSSKNSQSQMSLNKCIKLRPRTLVNCFLQPGTAAGRLATQRFSLGGFLYYKINTGWYKNWNGTCLCCYFNHFKIITAVKFHKNAWNSTKRKISCKSKQRSMTIKP